MVVDDPQPLILIGPGKQLRLRNVVVVHAASLPACLQLDNGSRLLVEEADGVQVIDGNDPSLEEPAAVLSCCH